MCIEVVANQCDLLRIGATRIVDHHFTCSDRGMMSKVSIEFKGSGNHCYINRYIIGAKKRTLKKFKRQLHEEDRQGIRQVWHQSKERGQAHILVCFLAYDLRKTLHPMTQVSSLDDDPCWIPEESGKDQPDRCRPSSPPEKYRNPPSLRHPSS